ncbi:MAG TPA: DoxX family protein [Puia sp.]|nr:DoxX family protein [Puia sp.]
MKTFSKFRSWGDAHHPKMLDIIRMLVGLLLVVKGYVYFIHAAYIRDLIIENKLINQSEDLISAIIFYTTYVQLVGGTMIFLGLLTRVASIFLLPIVFGAIFFVNILNPFFNAELWLSLLVMALLMLFIVIGSGPFSVDHFLSSDKQTDGREKR